MIIDNNKTAFEVINRYIDEFENEKSKLDITTSCGRICIKNIDSILRLLNDINYDIINQMINKRLEQQRKCGDLKE